MRFILTAVVALLAFLSAGCDQHQMQNTVPPEMCWVYPDDGYTPDPGVYGLAAVATDDRGMDFVFFLGTEMLGLVSAALTDTYRIVVDCRDDTGYVYQLRAFAYDIEHNGTSAADVTVYVRR